MNNMNLNLIVLLQRTIELLAFYLILANIDGKELKESFIRLIRTKQKKLYGNAVLSVVYLLAITYIIQVLPRQQGLLIDHIFRPFVALFLLRRVFSVKRVLLTYLLSMSISYVIAILALIFSLDGTFVFLWIFSIIIFISYQNYFENIYVRLLKKNWLFNTVAVASLILYLTPFFSWGYSMIFFIICALLVLLLFLVTAIYFRSEVQTIVDQLKNTPSDKFLELLKGLSTEHNIESDIIHHYIIRNHHFMEIFPSLSKALDIHKMLGAIKEYECTITTRQIKINIIL